MGNVVNALFIVHIFHSSSLRLLNEFTEKWLHNLYFEETTDVSDAISREKEIKKWRREKKNDLVQTINPGWSDLSEDWF